MRLAYEALARGGVAPAVLSAANEVAVAAFVEARIGFARIPEIIERTMERVAPREATIQDIREADREARAVASDLVKDIEKRSCC
ncbi:MAG: hypothetical protein KGN02_06385 [bacterium]|nr:hypothetical protein [bacterium]